MTAELPIVAAVVDAIERAVRAAVAPVLARLYAVETAGARLSGLPDQVAALAAASPVPGPPGPAGAPGADGAGVDLVTCDYDGERTVTFAWTLRGALDSGGATIVLPCMVYRGVHVPGHLYERGDCVTLDGSIFHCNADTTTRPGTGGAAWTLAVKHGRDSAEYLAATRERAR